MSNYIIMNFQDLVDKAYDKTKHIKKGRQAHYIPQLAKVDPNIFGISLCDLQGNIYHKGDYGKKVAIESISKLFSLAAAVKQDGTKAVFDKIGMHGSFLPFNSIIAAKLAPSHTINPFLNQGAMATTSLLYQKSLPKFKARLLDNMTQFAGTPLKLGQKVYDSESETNSLNMSLAYLLKSAGRFYAPVEETVDAYTYQCSVKVSADDLARMASVFANAGTHPVTGKELLDKKEVSYILNNLLPEGLYEFSDDWIAETGGGAYAKSGVGGGLLIVIPDVCGSGIVSPPLGPNGNSVRGVAAGIDLAKALGRPLFKSSRRTRGRKVKGKSRKRKGTRRKR